MASEGAILAFQFVAILAATFFSGAAIYINLAEHPAPMECRTQLAATVFGPSYRRAAVMQIILALTATIAGISAWAFQAISRRSLARYGIANADRIYCVGATSARNKAGADVVGQIRIVYASFVVY